MTTAQDYSIERLADRAQIQDVMLRWCRAIDRLDYEGIRSVFHPDAIDVHGIYNGGVDGLIEWIRGRHKTIPSSMHNVTNMLIEFAGADTALAETYCFAIQRYPADGGPSLAAPAGAQAGKNAGKKAAAIDLMGCARYVDRFERREGEWRIAHRTVVFDSWIMHEVSEDTPKMGADWTVGRRDRRDPVYLARAALGLID